MFRNYFKTAWRNLKRNRLYSCINIGGLSIGLAACLLVATVVLNNLSYDRQWARHKDIFRIIGVSNFLQSHGKSDRTLSGLGPELKKNFPEVAAYCRMSVEKNWFRMRKEADGVPVECLYAMDTSLWQILDFKVISGTPRKLIHTYPNIVLTETLAQEYFPNIDPVGKTIDDIQPNGDEATYLITGVIQDIPYNTHLYSQAIILEAPDRGLNTLNKEEYGGMLEQYLLLKPGTNTTQFTRKINDWYQKFIGNGKKAAFIYELQPITDIHLHPEIGRDTEAGGSIQNVYIFSAVAVFLLLIACFNFVNLTMARALKRIKETGIRKVLGAGTGQLIMQFLFESLLFFIISFAIAIFLYSLFFHPVELFVGHPVQLNILNHVGLCFVVAIILLMVCLFTGIYPAWLLSRPSVVTTLKGNLSKVFDTGLLRKLLIIVQFIIAISLIATMIVIKKQLYYIDHKDLGFNKNNLLDIHFNSWGKQGNTFKQEILQLPGVKSASITKWVPSGKSGYMTAEIADPLDTTQKIKALYFEGDLDLVPTLQLHLIKGRLLSRDFSADVLNSDSLMRQGIAKLETAMKKRSVLITAYTARLLGIKALDEPNKGIQGIPVGILKDFNNESLKEHLKPCIISADIDPAYGDMLIRVQPNTSQSVLAGVNKLWDQFYPGRIFGFDWVSDLLANQYKEEKRMEQLFIFFSSLSIFIACMGLLGLIAFTAEQKTKEIGVRKVIGASSASIVSLLSKKFLKLVLIAIAIATPIAWLAMNKWLQNFAYRINISWWIFALAGLLAIMIALITVSWQAIKAARANPVKSLRTE